MFILVRESVTDESNAPDQQSWPVRITASASAGGPAKIFVYHSAASPIADQDFFSCVASAPQMTELPAESPEAGAPFYRTSTLLVLARSAKHADEFWEKINRAVRDLADNLSLVGSLSVSETVTILPRYTPPAQRGYPSGALVYGDFALAYGSEILTYGAT
jgi:hypothetical protein